MKPPLPDGEGQSGGIPSFQVSQKIQTHSLHTSEYNGLQGVVTGPVVEVNGVMRVPVVVRLASGGDKSMMLQPKNLSMRAEAPFMKSQESLDEEHSGDHFPSPTSSSSPSLLASPLASSHSHRMHIDTSSDGYTHVQGGDSPSSSEDEFEECPSSPFTHTSTPSVLAQNTPPPHDGRDSSDSSSNNTFTTTPTKVTPENKSCKCVLLCLCC